MNSSPAKGKILVIRGGAIGDFILTLPAIAALRKQFPEAHLEVMGYPHIIELARAGGLVDRAQAIEARGLAGFFARNGDLSEGLRDYFSEFDIIVSYLYDPDEIFQTNVARCASGRFVAGPHRPDEAVGIHATEVFLKPLEGLAIFDADPVPRLSFGATRDTQPVFAIHPGSGSDTKNWPEPRWAAFLDQLINSTAHNLLLVGGEAEGARLEKLAAPLPTARCVVARSIPLVELAQRLQSCAGFAGHDSGITHLAAALGLPCLVLWADTAEKIWRPRGEQLTILREPTGIHSLSVARVWQEFAGKYRP